MLEHGAALVVDEMRQLTTAIAELTRIPALSRH
jgi:hypothetical protein